MMVEVPVFFIPETTLENQELIYADLARWCLRPVPKPSERIYSITYLHKRGEWTATVGKALSGVQKWITRFRGKELERRVILRDPAMVLAIFSGVPFLVVTNYRLGEDTWSSWENPIRTGEPNSITYFSVVT